MLYSKLYISDAEYEIRYLYNESLDLGKALWSKAWAIALEIMTINGEIDEINYSEWLR